MTKILKLDSTVFIDIDARHINQSDILNAINEIVVVVWEDSAGHAGWVKKERLDKLCDIPNIATTVGILTDAVIGRRIVIVQSRGTGVQQNKYSNPFIIPWGTIKALMVINGASTIEDIEEDILTNFA